MASLERTIYPVFARHYSAKELQRYFTPSDDEVVWITSNARSAALRLGLAVLLKSFQQLHYFPALDDIPSEIIGHIRATLGIGERVGIDYSGKHTLYRHMSAIRTLMCVTPAYGKAAWAEAQKLAMVAAELMDQRVDIINATIEGLVTQQYELLAFRTLDELAENACAAVQRRIFDQIFARLDRQRISALSLLIETDLVRRQSAFNDLKMSSKRASRKHLEMLVDHLAWLETFGAIDDLLEGVLDAKLRHFAAQAMIYDIAELKECTEPKRFTLLLSLIHRMQVRTRDQLAEMFLRRVATIHKRARDELEQMQVRQRSQVERLIGTLDGVLSILEKEFDNAVAGGKIRAYLEPVGGVDQMRLACAQLKATHSNNYLPLLWKHFKSNRSVLFRLVELLNISPTSQDTSVVDALTIIKVNQERHRVEWLEVDMDLSFASDRWRKLLLPTTPDGVGVHRRTLEICVFSYLADELRSGDLCVVGSEEFADYRAQLLSWEECEALLPAYCDKVGLPGNATDFVAGLRQTLTDTALQLDENLPSCQGDVSIGEDGHPILKKVEARDIPLSAIALQKTLTENMPPRHLLDILANIEHWIHFTRHFGPLSGHETKLKQPAERYLMTIFAMGCNLGPTQAARHLAGDVTPHMLSYVNRRHLPLEKLETAQRELIELYLRLDLPKLWGDGKTVAADGTQYNFFEENLLAGYHFRYRKMGAVAYRHVANNYIAVFQHFIPPGAWEAIYVIEGLLKTQLSVEADTVHSDTQGQSAAVFAFCHLLGIQLLPRIRNWKDLKMYRPDPASKYRHINRLFSSTADWELIETHYRDLMQVVLSIQTGKISSPTLLRKLGSYSRKNRLYDAAQALGNVVRTIFLLNWIGSKDMRRDVTANTNKIESYNGFAKWLSFGGDVIAENDPDEQQKRLRYNDLIASSVILQNTVDMMRALHKLQREGKTIDAADIDFLSPYQTTTIKRFGEYNLRFNRPPESWIDDQIFRQAAEELREKAANSPATAGATDAF